MSSRLITPIMAARERVALRRWLRAAGANPPMGQSQHVTRSLRKLVDALGGDSKRLMAEGRAGHWEMGKVSNGN